MKNPKFKRIIIVGQAGRGKTSLAHKLSEKLKIKYYSTDDFDWKVKFTEPEDRKVCARKLLKVSEKNSWIIEGSSRKLLADLFEKADLIIYLAHKWQVIQYFILFKRFLGREYERLSDLLAMYLYLFKKRFKISQQRHTQNTEKRLEPYESKVVKLYSFKEIEQFVEDFPKYKDLYK